MKRTRAAVVLSAIGNRIRGRVKAGMSVIVTWNMERMMTQRVWERGLCVTDSLCNLMAYLWVLYTLPSVCMGNLHIRLIGVWAGTHRDYFYNMYVYWTRFIHICRRRYPVNWMELRHLLISLNLITIDVPYWECIDAFFISFSSRVWCVCMCCGSANTSSLCTHANIRVKYPWSGCVLGRVVQHISAERVELTRGLIT